MAVGAAALCTANVARQKASVRDDGGFLFWGFSGGWRAQAWLGVEVLCPLPRPLSCAAGEGSKPTTFDTPVVVSPRPHIWTGDMVSRVLHDMGCSPEQKSAQKCQPCPRTPVTYVPGSYTAKRKKARRIKPHPSNSIPPNTKRRHPCGCRRFGQAESEAGLHPRQIRTCGEHQPLRPAGSTNRWSRRSPNHQRRYPTDPEPNRPCSLRKRR